MASSECFGEVATLRRRQYGQTGNRSGDKVILGFDEDTTCSALPSLQIAVQILTLDDEMA